MSREHNITNNQYLQLRLVGCLENCGYQYTLGVIQGLLIGGAIDNEECIQLAGWLADYHLETLGVRDDTYRLEIRSDHCKQRRVNADS